MSADQIYADSYANQNCDIRDHLPYLREVAKGVILEIGVRGGCSTSAFLLGLQKNGGHLFSVDIDASAVSSFAMHSTWTFIHENSANDGAILKRMGLPEALLPEGFPKPKVLDILFIDGDHEYAAVKRDLELYSPMIRPGGLILMHDVQEPVPGTLAGVRKAFDEFVARTGWQASIRPDSWGLGVIHVP